MGVSNKLEISASVLNIIDDDNEINAFYRLEAAKIDYFHIDVMDGKFVQNNTVEKMQKYADNIKGISNVPLDVHLMVEDVQKYVDVFAPCMPNIINFHIEKISNFDLYNEEKAKKSADNKVKSNLRSHDEIMQNINYIKENECKVGIAINPETDIEEVYKYLPYIHNVLLMSVHPGKGGQEFIKATAEKLSKLKDYIDKNNLENEIEVDGGINFDTIKLVNRADVAVVGKFLIDAKDYKFTVNKLKNG